MAQGVSEPLTCDGQTIVVNRHEHSFGLASRCCEAGCFTVYVRKAVRSDGMVFPDESIDFHSLFDRGRGGD